MNWLWRQEETFGEFSPEVVRFVQQALTRLEGENVCDAPGVISGVIRQMRGSNSQLIRAEAPRTERLLQASFARVCFQRIGA